MVKPTRKPRSRWLSKSRYAAKKRKEKELHGAEKPIVKLTPEEQKNNYVYHLENVTKRGVYIGYTPTPKKRIRQHNGELVNGAKRTKTNRPWSFGMILHFPKSWFHKIHALQLEWACKHFGRTRRQDKSKSPKKQYLVRSLPGRPSLSQRIDNLLWACHHCEQFTSNFPSFDASNPDHRLHIYLVDALVDTVKPLFDNVPYWNPILLPLSSLLE